MATSRASGSDQVAIRSDQAAIKQQSSINQSAIKQQSSSNQEAINHKSVSDQSSISQKSISNQAAIRPGASNHLDEAAWAVEEADRRSEVPTVAGERRERKRRLVWT